MHCQALAFTERRDTVQARITNRASVDPWGTRDAERRVRIPDFRMSRTSIDSRRNARSRSFTPMEGPMRTIISGIASGGAL